MRIFTSPYTNPFINLSLEDYFLRNGSHLPVLFLYVNRPCVVMGRFQNPWIETNLSYLVRNGIWLVRRQSGGGSVFHDEGNLNFSFIISGGMIDRKKYAELLRDAFKKVDIELEISPRNDLWLKDLNGVSKKISGSAYKQTRTASFHHGTFLVKSDLVRLEESLKHTLVAKETKSIASVRSKVITLQEKYPGIEMNDVIELLANHLNTFPFELDGTLLSDPIVQESFKNLVSWDWLWGETPFFELEHGFQIKKGIILSTGEKFSRESMKDVLEGPELERMFPDFSEQHRSSTLIL